MLILGLKALTHSLPEPANLASVGCLIPSKRSEETTYLALLMKKWCLAISRNYRLLTVGSVVFHNGF